MSTRRKKRPVGPQTAAGLVRFFEDVESRFLISPITLLIIASVFVAVVIVMNLFIK
ncbi:MAG: preprotein translocase subunit Sec61beta [Sulfolobales archaeon]|jgi:preprotein translocase subunit Sec61beta